MTGPLTGRVFNMQRFSLHDGPGIRTTVFLKGCPARCAWCHNPESQSFEAEILTVETRCASCGTCREVCPHGALFTTDPLAGRMIRQLKEWTVRAVEQLGSSKRRG